MFKIDIDNKYYYEIDKSEMRNKRTRERLQRIIDAGMSVVGSAQFGVPGVMSGLYIEKVWNLTDNGFNEYMKWAIELIDVNKYAVRLARI